MEQVQANDLTENKDSDIENQLDKDDGFFTMQMVHKVDEMDINVNGHPEPRPSDKQPSKSIHQDAEIIP